MIACTRSLGFQSALAYLKIKCSIIVVTHSQSVIHQSRRRGQSAAANHVDWRGQWLVEATAEGKLADVCTRALFGRHIRELCRLARFFQCDSEDCRGADTEDWPHSKIAEMSSDGMKEWRQPPLW